MDRVKVSEGPGGGCLIDLLPRFPQDFIWSISKHQLGGMEQDYDVCKYVYIFIAHLYSLGSSLPFWGTSGPIVVCRLGMWLVQNQGYRMTIKSRNIGDYIPRMIYRYYIKT